MPYSYRALKTRRILSAARTGDKNWQRSVCARDFPLFLEGTPVSCGTVQTCVVLYACI